MVEIAPPRREVASYTTTEAPAARARDAAESPATPPPTTAILKSLHARVLGEHLFADHRDELGVVVHAPGAVVAEAETGGRPARLDVEVEQHLDVVAQESDGLHHHLARATGGAAAQHVVDVGLEP